MAEDAPFLPGLSPVAGKPVHVGGSLGRTEATGRGGLFVLRRALERLTSAKALFPIGPSMKPAAIFSPLRTWSPEIT